MARRQIEEPRITHTEILALAIEQVSSRIAPYRDKLEAAQDENVRALVQSMIDPLEVKLGLLLKLYTIETGADYGYAFD